MSKPLFIWTMRRTGGTSLTALLTEISECNAMEHEPFNADRKLGSFIQDFRNNKDKNIIANELFKLFKNKPYIKHCYELFGQEFNNLILKSTLEQNYKYLFLTRENEVSRIMSLFLAQQTFIWGPEHKEKKYNEILSGKSKLDPFDIDKMVEHYKWCKNITNEIQISLIKKNQEFKIISFEDFYVGQRDVRLKKLYELFDYLEFDSDVSEIYKDRIEDKIFKNSQNSQYILEYVPNYKEAIETLNKLNFY